MKKQYFTKEDIIKIKENTSINNHGKNYEFIAHKIKSKKEKQFKSINKKHEQIGHLSNELSEKRHKLYQKLMEELRRKTLIEYGIIYDRL